jgi:hypothetical protein
MNPIAETLAKVELGQPAQFRNLAVYPLTAPSEHAPAYVLLDDALARRLARVTEISDLGSVPELMFYNDGDEDILLMDGEELVGAKQNRVLNVSILVAGKSQVAVPVSCVEQGRWRWRSQHFASPDRALFAMARAKKMRRVSEAVRRTGTYDSDQGEIWEDVGNKLTSLNVRSATASMGDAYEERAASIEEYVVALKPSERQVGAVFAVDGKVVGLDLFDSAAAFRKLIQKLVRSYAMDAIESPVEANLPVDAAVRQFLEDMKAAALQRFRAVGKGEQLRLETDTLTGSALYAQEHILHLCAFRVDKDAARRGGPLG